MKYLKRTGWMIPSSDGKLNWSKIRLKICTIQHLSYRIDPSTYFLREKSSRLQSLFYIFLYMFQTILAYLPLVAGRQLIVMSHSKHTVLVTRTRKKFFSVSYSFWQGSLHWIFGRKGLILHVFCIYSFKITYLGIVSC